MSASTGTRHGMASTTCRLGSTANTQLGFRLLRSEESRGATRRPSKRSASRAAMGLSSTQASSTNYWRSCTL
eukprot:4152687-Prorocentrum_lima.AAC.1